MADSEEARRRLNHRDTGPGYSLPDYLNMMWQRRWVIAGVVAVAFVVALASRPAGSQPRYQAAVSLRVRTYGFASAGAAGLIPDAVPGVPLEEVEAAGDSARAAARAAAELDLPADGAALLDRLIVKGDDQSDVLRLALIGPSPRTRRELESYVDAYIGLRNNEFQERVHRRIAGLRTGVKIIESQLRRVAEELRDQQVKGGAIRADTQARFEALNRLLANFLSVLHHTRLDARSAREVELLGGPVLHRLSPFPASALYVIVVCFGGLLIGCAMAIALGAVRPLVGDGRRLQALLGLPLLARIPRVAKLHGRVALHHRRVGGINGVAALRTELERERNGKPCVFAITSPGRGEGKSTIARNLAVAYTDTGVRTALVSLLLDSDDEANEGSFREASGLRGVEGVPVTCSSDDPDGAAGLVDLGRGLLTRNEVVLVDVGLRPDVAGVPRLLGAADGVVLVLRRGRSREDHAVEALQLLGRHGARVMGWVLNGEPGQAPARTLLLRTSGAASPRTRSSEPQPVPHTSLDRAAEASRESTRR